MESSRKLEDGCKAGQGLFQDERCGCSRVRLDRTEVGSASL